MYTERFSFPFVAGLLIAAAERRRPGLGPWSDSVRDQLRATFEAEMAEVRTRFLEVFDDPAYWSRVESALLTVTFPRYCAIAQKQTELEQRDYGLWRGGDLVARGTYAAAGLVLGIFMVKASFIPIPQTWDFFALLTALFGPFIPDVQVWLHQRHFRSGVKSILEDMKQAQEQLQLYPPLESGRSVLEDPLRPTERVRSHE